MPASPEEEPPRPAAITQPEPSRPIGDPPASENKEAIEWGGGPRQGARGRNQISSSAKKGNATMWAAVGFSKWRGIKGTDMLSIRGFGLMAAMALLPLSRVTSCASAGETNSTNVIIELRLAGDIKAIPPIRSCVADRLSQMPDVKVTTASTKGARFVVDVVAAENATKEISASLVVAEIFPMEEFRPRIKKGEDAEALLTSIQYYTLLRLHEVVPARSYERVCQSIVADLGNEVLSTEYTERND